MANTYSQVNVQIVFSVKERACLLRDPFRDRVFEYIAGLLRHRECFPLAVGGYYDHVHVFFELSMKLSIAEIARDIKRESSEWINQQGFFQGRFCWQEGYGAFSYSKSQRDEVVKYIQNQIEHHKTKSFEEEYKLFLRKFDIAFNDHFLFKPVLLPGEIP